MMFAHIVLVLGALTFLFLGLWSLVRPGDGSPAAGPVKPLMTAFLASELIGAAVCAFCAGRLLRPPRGPET